MRLKGKNRQINGTDYGPGIYEWLIYEKVQKSWAVEETLKVWLRQ